MPGTHVFLRDGANSKGIRGIRVQRIGPVFRGLAEWENSLRRPFPLGNAAICRNFKRVGQIERNSLKLRTLWRCWQSRANRSPRCISLLTGNLTGKSGGFGLPFAHGAGPYAAQFTVLKPLDNCQGSKKNREFFRRNRESKFPVTGSSTENLVFFCDLVAKSAPPQISTT